ncbi:MAG TPA: hypothetical protein VMS01_08090 [Stellaceae bacterium]|nr:hypothetical protein [Stellaceae bacterium]
MIYSFIAAVIALAACLVCPNAYAGPLQDGDLVVIDAQPGNIPIGYLVYDVVFPGNFGEFDIVNQTGPNSDAGVDSPPDFPVTTTVQFSSLSLTVQFSDGTTQTLDLGDFSLSADGESLDGMPFAVGGTSPQPVEAMLSGTLSPTSITVGSPPVTETIDASFTAPTLGGPVSIVPEPDMLLTLLWASFMALILSQRLRRHRNQQILVISAGLGRAFATTLAFAALLFPAVCAAAGSTIKQNTAVTPGTGVAGVSFVNVTASGVPIGTGPSGIPASNVTIKVAPTCTVGAGGPVAGEADATAVSITRILGSTDRFNFEIPGSLAQGTYFAQVVDTIDGFAGGNCSILMVKGTIPILNACLPTSSMGVVTGTTVTAYVPKGSWGSGTTGVGAVEIEPTPGGSSAAIATASEVNSCAGNPATGQVVCTANNTSVYLISGKTLTNTLTSGLTGTASFSGGACHNCGVAINALSNTAAIAGGLSTSPSGDGVQILNLSNNTFQVPFKTQQKISEDISIDPGRNLILSPNEANNYVLLSTNSATGGISGEFDRAISTGGEPDSAAEDCSTGIALSSVEFTNNVYLADLSQNVLTPGSPAGSWTSPSTLFDITGTSLPFSAGTSGISVAQGSSHLAIVTGEFGGNTFAVLQLQPASGTGGANPTVVDWVVGVMPNTPDGAGFSAGFDPHTVTAYTSPNTGKAIGLYADWAPGTPKFVGVIDMAAALAATRAASPNNHQIAAGINLITSGIVTYVAVP